ncbi:MAG: Ig-like domain-containing protein [Verrucomicrobiota bacterium]
MSARLLSLLWLCVSVGLAHGAAPLTTVQYRIVGNQLKVSPAMLSVPKGVAGSILAEVTGGGSGSNSLATGAYVEATLRGPAFEARRLVGAPNATLMLPPLNLAGDYQLDNIRLVDSATGAIRLEGVPSSVPVRVFDEVLISRVTSRPLTYAEIQEKGIAIDEQNFRAVEFEVGFVLDGKTIPVKFPVVAPSFKESTEIIPQAEIDAKLAQAQMINQDIAASVELPPELQGAQLNIDIQGINFQRVDEGEIDLRLKIPPIPALMVIPGKIGFLHQFFSVQIFTENAAPADSGLSVNNVQAQMILPPGPDQIASTNYNQPGDDPLRFARVGSGQIIQSTQAVVRPGPDGLFGTADDITRLQPGESGQAEFLVEGLQEGLHVMNVNLTADLYGLASGVVKIKGSAAGSVLVRNATFSIAFSHPRTVRAGEPYDAYVTLLNTSLAAANMVSVTLAAGSISGGVLESDSTVQLGTILPGQTATARFRIRAQRTGAVSFSNLTTGDDAVTGRFRLRMGIDERGVALSPDTIGMPDYVKSLPQDLVYAANRMLGQALSIATAPTLPPGVKAVSRGLITRRVLELAEAGQRLQYGDTTNRVLADIWMDWQGGRNANDGFDQILRETDAGREFRQAVIHAMELADALDATARLAERGADLAGRGEAWHFGAVNVTNATFTLLAGGSAANVSRSDVPMAAGYGGARGMVLVGPATNETAFQWCFTNGAAQATLGVWLLNTNGTGRQFQWSLTDVAAGFTCWFAVTNSTGTLQMDTNGDGQVDGLLTAVTTTVTESPPQFLGVVQDATVSVGRPPENFRCIDAPAANYGTVLAVLFSKPMSQEGINSPSAYQLDNGNTANSVQIQPGGRVALLNMRLPVGTLRARSMSLSGITDIRGNTLPVATLPVRATLAEGVALRGRVVRADGSIAAGIPVTLTMIDGLADPFGGCSPYPVRVCQMNTDANGLFDVDFVLANIPYTIAATDTSGLTTEASDLVMQAATADGITRSKLLDLASSPAYQNTLLGAFAAGAMPEAIAKAEGLDRALLRDMVLQGSPRQGTEVPVALRFRGRGTVVGQVLAADGATPVSQVAMNLFPDPDSRELGRGVFSDDEGRFAFYGVPLGNFSLQAMAPSGQQRTVVGLLQIAGQTTNLVVTLSTNVIQFAAARGRVVEADNVTPHPRATVMIGRYGDRGFGNVVAMVKADNDGYWSATNFPAGLHDIVALSLDGRRRGERHDVSTTPDTLVQVTVALQSTARVIGRVESSTGVAVSNAVVGGGEVLVRTDGAGRFTLTGVPTGMRSISAGVERNTNAVPPIDFPRLGSAAVNVVAGLDNFVVIRLRAAGQIVGRVLDTGGNPIPNTKVSLPVDGGFLWVNADNRGFYKFENMGLGNYTVSAPSPPVAETDVSGIMDKLKNGGSEEEIMAAIGDAFGIFTGATDPYLNGEADRFSPVGWGFSTASINFDGQTVQADIRALRSGTISGTVLNGQGVPIGARVRLTGIGPLANGMPSTVIRGERNSDPALGTFEFPNQALVGPWGLQVATPFYPVVLTTNGQTSSVEPNSTNNILRFPPTREINGRLAGVVLNPDGTHADADVNVKISFGSDYIIRTDTNGFFDTQMALPALKASQPGGIPNEAITYHVEADDPATGRRGDGYIILSPGITNYLSVKLLDRGNLLVTVLQGSRQPATNASVDVTQGSYPGDHYFGTTDTNGVLVLSNIFQGYYSIKATLVSGPTTIQGRLGINVPLGQTTNATVYLTPTATVRGQFVKRDLTTPIAYAQLSVGDLGFAATDGTGRFEVAGIPLGTYQLRGQDPVSGVGAVLQFTLSTDSEIKIVTLVEQFRGEVRGTIINSYGTGTVPNAQVSLWVQDGFTPSRTVTTGQDGAFSFPGTPAGRFDISAMDSVTKLKGSRSGVLPDNTALYQIDVPLQALATLAGTVYRPDGITPASNVTVNLSNGGGNYFADTGTDGRVSFADLPLGSYGLLAASRAWSESRSMAQTNVSLNALGAAPDFTLTLRGVGVVAGQVVQNDGLTPAAFATVKLTTLPALAIGSADTAIASASGYFSFSNVAVGPYLLTVEQLALGATYNGAIVSNAQVDSVQLVLTASGTVMGRVMHADGSNAVAQQDVLLTFNSHSGLPGQSVVTTSADGSFVVRTIPVGAFNLSADSTVFRGLLRLTSALTNNGQVLDLGPLVMDEDDPWVVSVTPPNTTVGVPVTNVVELLFNEALATNRINTGGLYLRSSAGTVAATVQLLPDPSNGVPRLVRIIPSQPLRSLTSYEVVVLDGDRVDAFGGVMARGPTDLVGRILVAPFISQFTTMDNDPPVLLSIYPTNGSVQIDPRAVVRLSFNEPIRDSNYVCTLLGTNGPVPGVASVGFNGLVLNFTPTAALDVNTLYTLSVSNVMDLAGNLATNQPFNSTFATLDTIGPTIATLRLASNRSPVAGGTVTVEAILAVPEDGAGVRFTKDFNLIGTATNAPYRVRVTLSTEGINVIRAIGIDKWGNEGPVAELAVAVVSNQPPSAQLALISAITGPVASGSNFTLRVSASDDLEVTNLMIRGVGVATMLTNLPSGDTNDITFTMPANAVAGIPFRIEAQATDALGLPSVVSTLDLDVSDSTAPTLQILSPAYNAILDITQPLEIKVLVSDNSSNLHLMLMGGGLPVPPQFVNLTNSANQPITNVFTLSLATLQNNGMRLSVYVSVRDDAGNFTSTNYMFKTPDLTPPQLWSPTPSDGAKQVSLWQDAVTFNFSEELDTNSLGTNPFVFTNNAGLPIPYLVTNYYGSMGTFMVQPLSLPLPPSVTFTTVVAASLADPASNRWQAAGNSVPPEGRAYTFTTATILGVSPTNAAVFTAGLEVPVKVSYEAGLGAQFFRFQFNSNAPVDVYVKDGDTNVSVLLPSSYNVTNAVITIAACRTNQPSYVLAPINIALTPGPTPSLDVIPTVTLVQGQTTSVTVIARDTNGLLSGLQVVAVPQPGDNHTGFTVLNWPNGVTNLPVQVIGGFNSTRGGDVSLKDGSLTADLRNAVTNTFPQVSLMAAGTLTRDYLQSLSAIFLASPSGMSSAITPLTAAEQSELRLFVEHGGVAILLVDNELFGGIGPSDLANESLVNAFGFTVAGLDYNSASQVIFANPAASPLTKGPYGNFSSFASYYPGWFDTVSPDAVVLGRLKVNNQPAVAVIHPKVLSAFSAPAFFFSDSSVPTNLILNALAMSGFTNQPSYFSSQLLLCNSQPGTSQVQVAAYNSLGIPALQTVTMITVPPPSGTVAFSAPPQLNLTEGDNTNLSVQVITTNGPITWLGFDPTNPPPTFASLGTMQFTNTGTNWIGSTLLYVNPMHDAAGSYLLTLRAVTQNGLAETWNIPVTVTNNVNLWPDRWIGSDGNWSTGPWSAVFAPAATNVAMLDSAMPLAYSVSLDVNPSVLGLVLNHTNVTLTQSSYKSLGMPVEIRQGRISVGNYSRINLTKPVVNYGGIQMNSGTVDTALGGGVGSSLYHAGLLRVDAMGVGFTPAQMHSPMNIPVQGKLWVRTNAVFQAATYCAITLAGVVELESGASFTFNNSLSREFVLLDNAVIRGAGLMQIRSANRLWVQGSASLGANLVLLDSSQVTGPGTLTIRPSGSLTSDHSLTNSGSLNVFGALSLNNPAATMVVQGTLSLNAGGVLTNQGTIQAGTFINQGGAIYGNAPVPLGKAALANLRFDGIRFVAAPASPKVVQFAPAPMVSGVALNWTGPAGETFVLEFSVDLRNWTAVPAEIHEVTSGAYQGVVTPADFQAGFYRLRWR